jgi:titin
MGPESSRRQFTTVSVEAPSNAAVSDIRTRSFRLSWNDNSANEDGFEIWVARGAGEFRLSERVPAGGTTALVEFEYQGGPRLTPNADYAVQVRAYRDNGQVSAFSSPRFLRTADDAPAGVSVGSVAEQSFRVSWADNSDDESGFEVWVKRGSGSYQLSERVPAGGTTALVEFESQGGARLSPNTGYTVKVRAYRDDGPESGFSAEIALQTAVIAQPNAPSNPQVSDVQTNSFRLSWADNSGNEDGFEIWLARSGGAFQLSERVPRDGTTALVQYERQGGPALSPDTSYQVKIRAYRENGAFSEFSVERTFRTESNRPPAPTNLEISDVQRQSFRLRWRDNSTNEVRFEVQIRREGSTQWNLSENVPASAGTGPVNALIEYERSGGSRLSPNTRYWVRVRAIGPDGLPSAWSDEVTLRTRA